MPAFVITNIQVTNPEGFKAYMPRAVASITQYGGYHLARGAETVTLEGNENTSRNGIIVFHTMEAAIRWYNSPEYQAAKKIREPHSTAYFYIMQGSLPET